MKQKHLWDKIYSHWHSSQWKTWDGISQHWNQLHGLIIFCYHDNNSAICTPLQCKFSCLHALTKKLMSWFVGSQMQWRTDGNGKSINAVKFSLQFKSQNDREIFPVHKHTENICLIILWNQCWYILQWISEVQIIWYTEFHTCGQPN